MPDRRLPIRFKNNFLLDYLSLVSQVSLIAVLMMQHHRAHPFNEKLVDDRERIINKPVKDKP